MRGISYGPFAPDKQGSCLPSGEPLCEDLERIAGLGINTLRVYHVPSAEVLEVCSALGLRLFITIPWTQHVDFFAEREAGEEAMSAVREAVRCCRGSEAVIGYFVANEIESSLVRWIGRRRVEDFLERLIEIGRREDEEALFAYPNYPSTEYLRPANVDLFAFNVYLEEPDSFRHYLGRLQNISGDKPLIISEFGLNAGGGNEAAQAGVFDWHWKEVCARGLAGSIWFSYTDEWFRGGQEVRDWHFGMVTRDRREREICARAREWFLPRGRVERAWEISGGPRVSVIVCSYNGTRKLAACLESLGRLRYPDYEVILVDDGSVDEVGEIARGFKHVRYLRQEHAGLSVARNFGAESAEGDILAYTDDDCLADEDWIGSLVRVFQECEVSAVGGPNIPPEAENMIEACVAAAPGSPSHVLLSDTEAEHIPGCNLAVRRCAFEDVGGFLPEFAAAGDDVDFCWRLHERGHRIGFCPAAMVWHHRRSRAIDYFQQQRGYGRAEALLLRRHPTRFGPVGGAHWRGVVYPSGGGLPPSSGGGNRIYQGTFGHAPFQRMYGGQESQLGYLVSSVQWAAITFVLLAAGAFAWWVLPAGLAMAAASLVRAGRMAARGEIAGTHDGLAARLCLFLFAWSQPLVRGWARWAGSLGFPRPRRSFPDLLEFSSWSMPPLLRLRLQERFWNECGRSREDLFPVVVGEFHRRGWDCDPGHGWEEWDLEISPRGGLWSARLFSCTEYHQGQRRLTRVRLEAAPTALVGLLEGVAILGSVVGGIFFGWRAMVAVLVLLAVGIGLGLAWRLLMLRTVRGVVRRAAQEAEVGA
ncbi:MAG: glycosyltransferase family 2 protein [Verrucomicrobiales bacterium]